MVAALGRPINLSVLRSTCFNLSTYLKFFFRVLVNGGDHYKAMIGKNIYSWNSKQQFFIGCFSWMIPNLYIKNSWVTKHPLKTGCLGF